MDAKTFWALFAKAIGSWCVVTVFLLGLWFVFTIYRLQMGYEVAFYPPVMFTAPEPTKIPKG